MTSGPVGGENIGVNGEVDEHVRRQQAALLAKAAVPGLPLSAATLEHFMQQHLPLEQAQPGVEVPEDTYVDPLQVVRVLRQAI